MWSNLDIPFQLPGQRQQRVVASGIGSVVSIGGGVSSGSGVDNAVGTNIGRENYPSSSLVSDRNP